MGSWSGKRWHPYLDEEAQERRDQILDHLKQNYDGPTHFVKEKLKEEQALDIDERIRRKEQNVNQEQEELEKLKQIRDERNTQDKLRDKRELLKEKQDKLREIKESGIKSREEMIEAEIDKRREHGHEITDELRDLVESRVDSKLERRPDVDELVETVERLQSQVAELNGGEEDYFMDIEAAEVKA